MPSRILPLLRLLIVVAAVAIVVLVGALLRFVLAGGSNGAPRSEAERAVVAAEEAVRANPNDPTARIKLAAAYLEEGGTGPAIEQAKIAVRLQPKSAAPYFMLGTAQAKAGDRKAAIKNMTLAVGTSGEVAQFYQDALVSLADLQEADGNRKAALESLGKAIDYGPENTLLLVQRGQMLERGKKFFEASLDYAWALQYVPDYEIARTGLERIKKSHPKEYKQAVSQVANIASGDHAPAPQTSPKKK